MARTILEGIPVSPGIAIAPLKMTGDAWLYEKRRIDPEEVEKETAALMAASAEVCRRLEATIAGIPENLAEYMDIISAQIELARDPRLLRNAAARISHLKICAAWALADTVEELAGLFNGMDDTYMRDRAQDIINMGEALAKELGGGERCRKSAENAILATTSFSPADMMEFKGKGLITVDGGSTSHTAILARGLKVPAIVGVSQLFSEARQDELVIMDGLTGLIIIDPDPDDLRKYENIQKNYLNFTRKAEAVATLPAITVDGKKIDVFANLDNSSANISVAARGAEGVGLYRTEFAFLGESLPDEEQLLTEYRQVITANPGLPVTIRTLDIGADKIMADYPPEPNPALGTRGIRFALKRTDLFRLQLRAILRAGADGNVSILLPMISTVWEVQAVESLLKSLREELEKEGLPHASYLPLGVMVETPAAVMITDFLVDKCDFLSIGTNDLLHYLLAIDRNNQNVSYLYDIFHPAFLRALHHVITGAHKKGLKVSICGELAADPLGIPLLIGLGADILSAAPRYVPAIKEIIRNLDAAETARLVQNALDDRNVLNFGGKFKELLGAFLDRGLIPYNMILSPYNKA